MANVIASWTDLVRALLPAGVVDWFTLFAAATVLVCLVGVVAIGKTTGSTRIVCLLGTLISVLAMMTLAGAAIPRPSSDWREVVDSSKFRTDCLYLIVPANDVNGANGQTAITLPKQYRYFADSVTQDSISWNFRGNQLAVAATDKKKAVTLATSNNTVGAVVFGRC